MKINKCKVCNYKLFKDPLLSYKNMPAIAQNLPDAHSLKNDKGVDLDIYQCSGCGLVQLNCKPVPYYRKVIRASGFSKEMRNFREKQFNSFVKKYSLKNKKIIEIGCGYGEYLSIWEKYGVIAHGLEYNQKSVDQCINNNLMVSRGYIQRESDRLEYAPFDAFCIFSFFEHLPDPNIALRGIFNNLKDNAVGIVEVPNFDMILKKKLFSEFMKDHLFYFTKETLSIMLKINGFEVIECKEIWHDYIISAVVKKKKKTDLSFFYKQQIKLKKEVEKYISLFPNKKVIIWGAGHQALAVISLMNLAGKIKYVVDSAKFKQGKYTPVTHIPIVSPETLDLDPVDVLIIMAAAYSDEIAKILQKKYGNKIHIAILRDFGLECLTSFNKS